MQAIPTLSQKIFWALSDTSVMISRSIKHITKNPDQLLGLTIQPIMFMLLFRYVFGGAIDTGGVSYVNFLVAGILVQTAAFGATTTSLSLATDLQRGVIDRFKSMPIFGFSVVIGHIVGDLFRNVISAIVMISVAFAVGFRPTADFTEWLAILGILLLFTLTVSWLSAIMGLLAPTLEAVQWLSFLIVFPLTFASGAFVPTDSMPTALRWFAQNQPVTHVIEALRAYMVGTPIENHALLSVVWCVALIIFSIPTTAYLFARHKR